MVAKRVTKGATKGSGFGKKKSIGTTGRTKKLHTGRGKGR